jgi:hypothetical protein
MKEFEEYKEYEEFKERSQEPESTSWEVRRRGGAGYSIFPSPILELLVLLEIPFKCSRWCRW